MVENLNLSIFNITFFQEMGALPYLTLLVELPDKPYKEQNQPILYDLFYMLSSLHSHDAWIERFEVGFYTANAENFSYLHYIHFPLGLLKKP